MDTDHMDTDSHMIQGSQDRGFYTVVSTTVLKGRIIIPSLQMRKLRFRILWNVIRNQIW